MSRSKTHTDEQIGDFWDSHDFTEFDSDAPDVEFEVICLENKIMAHIVAVCASQRRNDPKVDIGAGEVVAGHGLVGDAHASYSEREVSLLGIESVRDANREHGIAAGPGAFAENLTVEGLDLLALHLGDRLLVDEHVLLEVVQIGKPPSDSHTYNYQGVSILPRKGVFCRVLHGGRVTRGDEVAVSAGEKPCVSPA